jgi:hypothetical protein
VSACAAEKDAFAALCATLEPPRAAAAELGAARSAYARSFETLMGTWRRAFGPDTAHDARDPPPPPAPTRKAEPSTEEVTSARAAEASTAPVPPRDTRRPRDAPSSPSPAGVVAGAVRTGYSPPRDRASTAATVRGAAADASSLARRPAPSTRSNTAAAAGAVSVRAAARRTAVVARADALHAAANVRAHAAHRAVVALAPARDLRDEARNLEVDEERWIRANQLLSTATSGRGVLPEYAHVEVPLTAPLSPRE